MLTAEEIEQVLQELYRRGVFASRDGGGGITHREIRRLARQILCNDLPETVVGGTSSPGTDRLASRCDHQHRLEVTSQEEGVTVSERPTLNFVGAGVTVTDDAGDDRTTITIPGGGGALCDDNPEPILAGVAADPGVSALASRCDHVHEIATDVPVTVTGDTNAEGAAMTIARSDHQHRLELTVRENSGADVGSRPRLNFIEGANIALTIVDDGVDDEIDITIDASIPESALLLDLDFSAEPDQAIANGNNVIAGLTWIASNVGNTSVFAVQNGTGLRITFTAANTDWSTQNTPSLVLPPQNLVGFVPGRYTVIRAIVDVSGLVDDFSACAVGLMQCTPGAPSVEENFMMLGVAIASGVNTNCACYLHDAVAFDVGSDPDNNAMAADDVLEVHCDRWSGDAYSGSTVAADFPDLNDMTWRAGTPSSTFFTLAGTGTDPNLLGGQIGLDFSKAGPAISGATFGAASAGESFVVRRIQVWQL